MFNLVFFIVITSLLVHGSSIPLVARWLGVDEPVRLRPRPPLEFEPAQSIRGDLVEIEVPPGANAAGKQIVELGLPTGALLVLIGRDDKLVVPGGSTVLEVGDTVLVLADDDALASVRQLLELSVTAEPEES